MTTALAAAGQRRTEETRRRAIDALRRLDNSGEAITYSGVAHEAGVSRSWLYRQPDLRTEIDRLRNSSTGATAALPSAQRATTASLRRRLEAALDELTRVKTENRQLREQLAQRIGHQRTDGTR